MGITVYLFYMFVVKKKKKKMEILSLSTEIVLLLIFGLVFSVTYLLLPRIRKTTLKFDLYDTPDHRSSHKEIVPTFGGVAFFICIILVLFFIQYMDTDGITVSMLVACTITFFVGLKDDFQNLSPKVKFFGQILSVGMILSHPEFQISSFHGFLGIQEIPLLASIGLSAFLFLGFINAFNLIDGIDGHASIVGIVISVTFGLIFYKLEMFFYLAICVVLVSTLFAFLRFNFSNRQKIFMGDTGSLVIGLVLGALAMRLLSLGFEPFSSIAITRTEIPLLLLGVLIIPALDISRVIFIRLVRKKSIFSPDRNHIHHVLIDAGLSHMQASILIGIVNAIIIASSYFALKYFDLIYAVLFFNILVIALVLSFFILNRSIANRRTKVYIRAILFRLKRVFSKSKDSLQEERLAFNQKLKKIGILFF